MKSVDMDLTVAAEAFLGQFLGKQNWALWSALRDQHGFASNHEFTSWLLSLAEHHERSARGLVNGQGATVPAYNHQSNGYLMHPGLPRVPGIGSGLPPGREMSSGFQGSLLAPVIQQMSKSSSRDNVRKNVDSSAPNIISSTPNMPKRNLSFTDSLLAKAEMEVKRAKTGTINGNADAKHSTPLVKKDEHQSIFQSYIEMALKQMGAGPVITKSKEYHCKLCGNSFLTEEQLSEHEYLTHSSKNEEIGCGDLTEGMEDSNGIPEFVPAGVEPPRLMLEPENLHTPICNNNNTVGLLTTVDNDSLLNSSGESRSERKQQRKRKKTSRFLNPDVETAAAASSSMVASPSSVGSGNDDMLETSSVGSASTSGAGVRVKCDYCEQTLSSRNNLRRHVLSVHWQLKNYACRECGKSFARSDHLKQHKCLQPSCGGPGGRGRGGDSSLGSSVDSVHGVGRTDGEVDSPGGFPLDMNHDGMSPIDLVPPLPVHPAHQGLDLTTNDQKSINGAAAELVSTSAI